jgi:hypothetical protein
MSSKKPNKKNELNINHLLAILGLIVTLMAIVVAYQSIVVIQTPRATSEPTAVPNPTAAISPTASQSDLETIVNVSAQHAWQATGFSVVSGQQLHIEVIDGSWTVWEGVRPPTSGEGSSNTICATVEPVEDCFEPIADAPSDALIGRIGVSGKLFPIGGEATITIPDDESGMLFLSMNDFDFEDNAGALTVRITLVS